MGVFILSRPVAWRRSAALACSSCIGAYTQLASPPRRGSDGRTCATSASVRCFCRRTKSSRVSVAGRLSPSPVAALTRLSRRACAAAGLVLGWLQALPSMALLRLGARSPAVRPPLDLGREAEQGFGRPPPRKQSQGVSKIESWSVCRVGEPILSRACGVALLETETLTETPWLGTTHRRAVSGAGG